MPALLASFVAFGGCASNGATGVASNGGVLRVQYSSGIGTYVSDDVVGTDVNRDANGNEIGTTDHVEARSHSYAWSDWKYYQGRDELDEQDYYRLAGDMDAERRIAAIRTSASRKQRIGVPLAIAGYAAVAVLGTIALSSNHDTLAAVSYIGGAAAGTVGGLLWYWGYSDLDNRHLLPRSRAEGDSDVIEECQERR